MASTPLTKIAAHGTMVQQWSIGKGGPTIYVGNTAPTVAGVVGDLYVQYGVTAMLSIATATGWLPVANPSLAYRLETATTTNFSPQAATSYLGVNIPSASTIQLPGGAPGKTLTIKDESGLAGTNNITVSAGSSTIDGASTFVIDINNGVLNLVYSNSGWRVLGGIFSTDFNQMKV